MIKRWNEQKNLLNYFSKKNGEEITQLYLKFDKNLLPDVFGNIKKISIKKFDVNPLYFVSLPGYAWQGGLKFTNNKIQTLQEKG